METFSALKYRAEHPHSLLKLAKNVKTNHGFHWLLHIVMFPAGFPQVPGCP